MMDTKQFYIAVFCIFTLLFLTGCTTTKIIEVPVVRSFPTPPEELMVKPDQLMKIPEHSELQSIASITASNYSKYHTVAERLELLQEWVTKIIATSNDNTTSK